MKVIKKIKFEKKKFKNVFLILLYMYSATSENKKSSGLIQFSKITWYMTFLGFIKSAKTKNQSSEISDNLCSVYRGLKAKKV